MTVHEQRPPGAGRARVLHEPGWGSPGEPRYLPIEGHGLIGDLRTAALVGRDGTIDWFCPGRFDAPSMFAAVLDADRGGAFRVAPPAPCASKQLYLPDTAILLTRFFTPGGVAELTDFMPVGLEPCALVRRVDVVRGAVEFRMSCRPGFDYARRSHRVHLAHPRLARFTAEGGRTSELSSGVPLEPAGAAAEARFRLRAGERTWFVLQPGGSGERWSDEAVARLLDHNRDAWRRWLAHGTYDGRWREMVQRSAITLKLCTYDPTGAMIAAPTTSLPEAVGGRRNWDYRYAWLRDSAFTAFAFQRLGHHEEARRFAHWLERRCRETDRADPQLQIVYDVDGGRDLAEVELPHLEGYRGSRPVRIGNGAHRQLQLDVYGELMDAVYLSDKEEPISWDLWTSLRRLLDWLAGNWQRPDEGIWEVRGGPRDFVYSRLMCWVAFERAMRMQRRRGLPADTARWRAVRDAIYEEIMERGWSEERRAFVQYYGGTVLDASNLLMPLVKFIGPRDPRMLATLAAVERDLVSDSLVYRYDPGDVDDGLDGSREGSFSLCSFWLVECLTRAGRLDDARLVFEKMLTYANPVGLFAEQVGDSGEALGNFPQAFTHLGLISAAWDLDRALGRGA
ncbi:glycoside hydrolase family 15 protein [Miltoncostaea marina]|uniref:glycoside hydrolase family 15 protein n=1 Tax=Miltoncostaea marina TaxID=2843215 RepID=UPI001C3CC804|nr:glycoside hydrolase family 15 protein [Miltoncostaea marina]